MSRGLEPRESEAQASGVDRDLLARAFLASPLRQGVIEILPDDLRILAANDAAARFFGAGASHLAGQRGGDLDLPAGLLDTWLESCFDAWRTQGTASFRFNDPSTEPPRRLQFLVAPFAAPVGGSEGDQARAERWCCTFQIEDVQVRVTDQDAVGDDAHFRNIADSAPAMLWASNPHGERDYFNRTWLRFTGRDAPSSSGDGWLQAVHQDDRETCREVWMEAFLGREPFRLEYRLSRADGAYRWVFDSAEPRFRSDGEFLGFVGTCVDISKRRQAEEWLRISERWYRELIESTDNLVIQIDSEDLVTFVNRRSREIWQAEPEECVGFPFLDFAHPDDRPELEQWLAALRDHDEAATFEARHRGRRGAVRTLLWTVNPHRDADGQLVSASAIGQDVTERRRAEEERSKLDAHLREMQRLESLGVLAGGIAHDFNNLLMTILGNANLLLQEVGEGAAMRADLEQIESAALRAAELTRQMLAYSGKGRFVVEPTDLSSSIREMRPLLATSISPAASLELDLDEHLPLIESDGGQIRQLVINLVTNASEALDGKPGTITLSTGRRRLGSTDLEDLVLGRELEAGEYVALEVRDDGLGMDEEVASRIFDPFFTTKFTGRGLGLAAVLGIVRGHSGALRVASSPGAGTAFTIFWPVVRPPKAEVVPIESRSAESEGTVLVVDDDDEVRAMACRMLGRLGFEVLEAPDGAEALELYAASPESVDCVLLDLSMPGMDGDAVLRELRLLRPDVRVILSSGYGEPDDGGFGDDGRTVFLQKPYRQTDLILTLDRILDLRH